MVTGNTLRQRAAVCYRDRTMAEPDLPEHVQKNRVVWDALSSEYAAAGRRGWAQAEPTWGIWHLPEAEVRALPEVEGKDVIELGCGTAYWSAWMARRGARVVGIDNSAKQLATARALQEEHGLDFPLLHGNAERVPLPDASFDLALSEYGASLWCDPYRWVPEASRLLRPGGHLIFLKNGTLLTLCLPDDDSAATERLRRDSFGLHRLEWADTGTVEFALPVGDWVRLLRANGFELLDLMELRAPQGASTRYTFVTSEWAHRWPSEEIWRLRKRAP
jgi:SAM-dependent methyltransferase